MVHPQVILHVSWTLEWIKVWNVYQKHNRQDPIWQKHLSSYEIILPHPQPQVWDQTDRISDPNLCELHWPGRSVGPCVNERLCCYCWGGFIKAVWDWMEQVFKVPVRHSHNYTLYTSFAGLVNNHLQGRDKDLTAFQTKAFLWRPFASKKVFKPGTLNRYHRTFFHCQLYFAKLKRNKMQFQFKYTVYQF